jgi:hypothetical protein
MTYALAVLISSFTVFPARAAIMPQLISGFSGTTYYVDNCGVMGDDSNDGKSPSTPWLTVNKVNTSTLSPGDSVLFESTCTWREQLRPPSSGSVTCPITFAAYGRGVKPIITGSDVMTGFSLVSLSLKHECHRTNANPIGDHWTTGTSESGRQLLSDNVQAAHNVIINRSCWNADTLGADQYSERQCASASLTNVANCRTHTLDNRAGGDLTDKVYQKTSVIAQPKVVAYNGSLLKYHHAGKSIATNEWDWASNVLYINVGGHLSGGTVEVGQRTEAVLITSKSHIVFENLALKGANVAAIMLSTSAADVTIQNSDINHTFWGIATENDTGNSNTVRDNVIHDTVEYGINWGQGGNSATGGVIQRNIIYNIGGKGGGSTNRQGIYTATGAGLVIEYNSIHDGGDDYTDHGIYSSSVNSAGNPGRIAYNLIYNFTGYGIKVSYSRYVNVFYNVMYNNCCGIIEDQGSPDHINVYNNTIGPNGVASRTHNSNDGVGLRATTGSYITWTNNIVYGINYREFSADTKYNLYLGASVTNFSSNYNLVWSPTQNASGYYATVNGVGKTWAQWQGLGYDTNGINSDPKLKNPTNGDFTLQSSSPAINVGANLGSPYNMGLDPLTTFPWGRINQNSFGAGWEIGAFVYRPWEGVYSFVSAYKALQEAASLNGLGRGTMLQRITMRNMKTE